jgi:glucose/arabinose dehydrogenase
MKWFFAGLMAGSLMPQTVFAADTLQPGAKPDSVIERIADSNLALDLTDFIQIPASDKQRPLARINYLYHAGDGSGRLFVNDMRGKIYIIRNGMLLPDPFLDVAAVRGQYFLPGQNESDERGLLSFAFHPDFRKRGAPGYGKFYTIHAERGDLEVTEPTPLFRGPRPVPNNYKVICEWTLDPMNPNRIDPASRREILRLAAPSNDHSGGQLGFDPNLASDRDADYGLLYISVGDGGNTARGGGNVEAYRQAQDMQSPFGKILRIQPLAGGSRPYSVPDSNPFAHRNGILPEIWATGLRNPERFSWDRGGSRRMLIADIGQANAEEIDIGKPGANYGWSIYEGEFIVDHQDQTRQVPLPGGKSPVLPSGFTFPAAEYGHPDGFAITGGFVYRGKSQPELAGKYIFGDLMTGELFYADAQSLEAGTRTKIFKFKLFYRGQETTMRDGVLGKDRRADLRFGMGEDGEIYVLTKRDGMIRRISQHRN